MSKKKKIKGVADRQRGIKGASAGLKEAIDERVVFSFKDLDRTQGDSIDIWERNMFLGKLLEKIVEISRLTRKEAVNKDIIAIYDDFPPNSNYKHPEHVPEDAEWARFHIQGKIVVAGHMIDCIFYVVFLDGNHDFWPTPKKNT